jgi:mannose-6-phosphate isomerase-like protein (cupin superfamily)
MPNYTIKNLLEVDETASARNPQVEGRFGRSSIDSEHLGVSLFRYAAGYQPTIGHRHREQEEVYVVLSGSGRVRLDDDIVDVGPWDVVRVAPSVVRGFAAGPDGLEVLAVGSDRPEGGDGELVADWWVD